MLASLISAMRPFTKFLRDVNDYTVQERITTLNAILIRYLEILTKARKNLTLEITSEAFVLPPSNILICNVRLEAIASDFFKKCDQHKVDEHGLLERKLCVWNSIMKELVQYFVIHKSSRLDEDTLEHIIQCACWPLTCSLSKENVSACSPSAIICMFHCP